MPRIPNVVRLSRAEVQTILNNERWQQDPEMSSLTSTDAYLLADGRLLLVSDEDDEDDAAFTATLWQSKELFVTQFRQAASESSVHVLADRLPQGEHFAARVIELIDELADQLNIPRSSLDFSVDSIEMVDELVRKNYTPLERASPPLFPRLVAYVGETILHAAGGGKWEMRPASTPGIWEPWVITLSGKEFPPFATVWKEFYDHSDAIGNLAGGIEVFWG